VLPPQTIGRGDGKRLSRSQRHPPDGRPIPFHDLDFVEIGRPNPREVCAPGNPARGKNKTALETVPKPSCIPRR